MDPGDRQPPRLTRSLARCARSLPVSPLPPPPCSLPPPPPCLALQGSEACQQTVLETWACFLGGCPEVVTKCINFITVDWPSQQYTGGAYTSFMMPGAWTSLRDAFYKPCGRIHWWVEGRGQPALPWSGLVWSGLAQPCRAQTRQLGTQQGHAPLGGWMHPVLRNPDATAAAAPCSLPRCASTPTADRQAVACVGCGRHRDPGAHHAPCRP